MSSDLQDRVRREVEGLHAFFVGWFGGRIDESRFERDFTPRFSPDLLFIPPAGRLLGLSDLSQAVRQSHASNPDFRIQIRNVRVAGEYGNHALATYEEWQRNARQSTPPDNARIATALFEVGPSLRWKHIHETWLPADVTTQDAFDF